MNTQTMPARLSDIAAANDRFRKSGEGVVVTQGVQALPGVIGLLDAVRGFEDFTPDNDPYGEHDFGTIYWHGEKVFWKIDYYDRRLEFGEDPLSPDCRRVITVMLASEY